METKTNYWKFQSKTAKIGELMIYGYIVDEKWADTDVTPKQFKKDMDALGDIDTLNIYINSGGGSVFAAMAMLSMLKRNKAKKEIHIDGIAASAASFFVGAGKVIMPSNAMMMVHNPAGLMIGTAKEARKLADDLDKIRESMLAIYSEKTGMSNEEIIPLLDAETWMTAKEAVEYGFADELEEEKKMAASISGNKFFINGVEMDLNNLKNRESFEKRFAASGEKRRFNVLKSEIVDLEKQLGISEPGANNTEYTIVDADYVDNTLKNNVERAILFVVKDLELSGGPYHTKYIDSESRRGFINVSEPGVIYIKKDLLLQGKNMPFITAAHELRHWYQHQKLGRTDNLENDAVDYSVAALNTFLGCPTGSTGWLYGEIKPD